MGDSPDSPEFTAYGPDRFAEHLPFGRIGYLFTVPGDFPAEVPDFCRVTDWEMAVYRTRASGVQMWEVRDVNVHRRVWGEARRRCDAVGMALLEIARKRREDAAEIRERRVSVLGLEPEPPYRVETSGAVDLVLSPGGVGRLIRIEPNGGKAATYRYTDLATGRERTVVADGRVTLLTVAAGLLHARCACPAPDLVGFHETREDAAAYLTEEYDAWWPCTGPAA
ncbi:hypothetical protein AB0D24_04695 [Streptomyces javensis]|uniref:hypothetical protein n=1 Tax=Streptomyces javensis TaxID=114698 RepID=UPI0033D6B6ED